MTQVVLWFQYQLSRNSSDLWGLVSKARERARARALWRSPWTQPRINLKWCLYIGFNKKNRDASINTSKNIWAWFEFLILIPVETIWRGGEFGGNPWIHLSGVRVYWHEQKLVLASSLPHCIFYHTTATQDPARKVWIGNIPEAYTLNERVFRCLRFYDIEVRNHFVFDHFRFKVSYFNL